MNKTFIASLLVAVSAVVAVPAFASSGYGPSPSYNPLVGAPASERGQSAQTIAAEARADTGSTGYGGIESTGTQSGHRVIVNDTHSLYSHS